MVTTRRQPGLGHERTNVLVSGESASSNDFVVGHRIRIGLDALSGDERAIVEDVTSNKTRFLAWIADSKRVEKVRPNAPYLSLRLTRGLRLIYIREGDQFDLLDIVNQAWLDRYASKPRSRSQSATPNKTLVSSKRARRCS